MKTLEETLKEVSKEASRVIIAGYSLRISEVTPGVNLEDTARKNYERNFWANFKRNFRISYTNLWKTTLETATLISREVLVETAGKKALKNHRETQRNFWRNSLKELLEEQVKLILKFLQIRVKTADRIPEGATERILLSTLATEKFLKGLEEIFQEDFLWESLGDFLKKSPWSILIETPGEIFGEKNSSKSF